MLKSNEAGRPAVARTTSVEKVVLEGVQPATRLAFYAFIATIPFETIDVGAARAIGSLSKLAGYLLIMSALFQPRLCFSAPPRAFWCFVCYLGAYLMIGTTVETQYFPALRMRLFTLTQMLILFWIACNLFKYEDIRKGSLLALVGACIVLSLLQVTGITASNELYRGRVSAFGENPNNLGDNLALGMVGLVGLAHGRLPLDGRMRIIGWVCCAVLASAIVMTGSRGAMVSLFLGLTFIVSKGGTVGSRARLAIVATVLIGLVGWIAYTNDEVRSRWESALFKGDLAVRESIMPAAWQMFLEEPLIGWGPVYHYVELGSRFGQATMDTHNLYLWIITETGLLGSIPFFFGIGMAVVAAWRGRWGREGSLPLAMLVCLLAINMSGTWHNRKLFWLMLAYGLVSGTCYAFARQYDRVSIPQSRIPLSPA